MLHAEEVRPIARLGHSCRDMSVSQYRNVLIPCLLHLGEVRVGAAKRNYNESRYYNARLCVARAVQ
jgi:hypothetical protein